MAADEHQALDTLRQRLGDISDHLGGGVMRDEPESKSGRRSRPRLKTKTKTARRIALPAQLVAELRAHQVAQKRERLAAGVWPDCN
ncbi:hypothetical protein HC031_29640 [Planosporangium thailandense]|uniref:Uncharacterized protein n=1 Tax=Planosporangium thailandense TaxID=765197 RepID=A0ABX0Y5Z9_9ACTN|nr:hypothetical protein [Planosporangium thailandense]NJC73845.1 hypothetical protein [Planosporangium thailandense]